MKATTMNLSCERAAVARLILLIATVLCPLSVDAAEKPNAEKPNAEKPNIVFIFAIHGGAVPIAE